MNQNQRFSILTFPQYFDGSRLSINILILPRNQNPFAAAIEPSLLGQSTPAKAFVDAQLKFKACMFNRLETLPYLQSSPTRDLVTVSPKNVKQIFASLGKQFTISARDIENSNYNLEHAVATEMQPPKTKPVELTVRKYLPRSYRQSFNFTTPGIKML